MAATQYHPGLQRTTTSSTASTMYPYGQFADSMASSQTTVPLASPLSSRNSPKILSPSGLGPGRFPRQNSNESTGSRSSNDDELDNALQQRLVSAARPASMLPTSPTAPDVSRFSVSSAGSRYTMHSMRSPEIPLPSPDDAGKRKKSGLRISIGGSKNDLKLPKEFVLEFWTRLAAEDGDNGWLQSVSGFLLLVHKKGTKVGQANMREIPALLQRPNSASHGEHRAHMLRSLYHALPASTYFTSSKSDKDKDLLFRLRAEIQTLMYQSPTAEPESAFSPILMANGMAARAANSPGPMSPGALSPHMASPSRASPGRPQSGQVQEIRRKPSPAYDGIDTTDTSDLVRVVGLVWGVSQYALDGDLQSLGNHGPLEKLYLGDLKTKLTVLARMTDPASRSRCSLASGKLASLLSTFPELTQPGSPGTGFAQAAESPIEPFFTPPRKAAVFANLVRRIAEAGNTIRAAELLEHCQVMWEVEGRAEKEREVEGLFGRWEASVGTQEEPEWCHRLCEAAADLVAIASPSEPVPRILEHIRGLLFAQLSQLLQGIFPTTSALPPAPSGSLLPILRSVPSVFLRSQEASKILSELADELRGAAVGEYVMAASEMGIHQYEVGARTGESGKDAVVEGFEKLASWIETEVNNVRKVWKRGLGPDLDPAAIIIGKQLPLFLAEIQVLETANGAASDVFHLYEVTSRLLVLWDKLCPGVNHGFDLDAFFEPHVVTWLRETEVNETYQWVARTIGMDEWIPEGDGRYSQSVTDLFEFIRGSTQLVRDLPLSEYKRAVFLIDLSKTASIAVKEYANSVHMLFQTDMAPPKTASAPTKEIPMPSMGGMGGKAGAWLAKGRHAVAKVEQKLGNQKAEGFIVPAAALVKMTNMGAAQAALEDVGYFMEADKCANVIRAHKLTVEAPATHRFSITLLRGQNLLTRSAKPADALVTVGDTVTGERLFKSRTVLETEDPKWEQSFEVSISGPKALELTALDRQMVGKHDPIGMRSFKLDPALFSDMPVRDIVLPLSPRGVVHLRISLDASSVYDVSYHLASASRMLDNTGSDMMLEIVDRMAEFIRVQLSRNTLNAITKPLRDKKRGRIALTDVEIDNSLAPVFDYFDENFALFKETITDELRIHLMLAIWCRTVDILISLIIPPLADRPATNSALAPAEVDIVFKWLQQLKAFFNASEGGVEYGVPLHDLQTGGYKDMLMVGQYLDLPTPSLRERTAAAVRAASSVVRTAPLTTSPKSGMRALSLYGGPASSRARVGEDNERMAEVLLRILRMRPDTHDFLQAQLGSLIKGKVDRQGGLLC